jgi:hypothetical protein
MGVREIAKPRGQECPHCKAETGCTIYDTRPSACRSYMCRFLLDDGLDENWRPDRSGIVVNTDRSRIVIYVDPERPGAWLQEPFYSKLKQWSWNTPSGWPVYVCIGDSVVAVYPNRDVEVNERLKSTWEDGDPRLAGDKV